MIKHMKRIFTTLAIALIAVFAYAQNNTPAGMRFELAEYEDEDLDNEYAVFSYKDDDGTVGYFLGLGHEFNIVKALRDDVKDVAISHIKEVCLYLGTTSAEAIEALDGLLKFLDEKTGTAKEFPCRMATGAEKLGDASTTTCIVTKRFLQAKRLCFHFTTGTHTAEVDLTKSAIKSLKNSLKLTLKLHPTW